MPIQSKNLHYAYYHEYYDGIDITVDPKKQKNEALQVENIIRDNSNDFMQIPVKAPVLPKIGVDFFEFQLKTTYPGLLTGAGVLHSGKIKNEFGMGFLFDYVTGCPYVSGSSIKGMLRHAFNEPGLIPALLEKDVPYLDALKNNIFGMRKEEDRSCSDIFFDAYPITGQKGEKVMAEDYITPHEDITKNPDPIRFIKVKPDVTFRFCFLLKDFVQNGQAVLSAAEKCDLFKSIILLLGLGAKTNVGYGAFAEVQDKNVVNNRNVR